MEAYIVKEGISGDGFSIMGIYTDYQLARELCDSLLEKYHYAQYYGNDYWADDWGHYICIMVIELDKEIS